MKKRVGIKRAKQCFLLLAAALLCACGSVHMGRNVLAQVGKYEMSAAEGRILAAAERYRLESVYGGSDALWETPLASGTVGDSLKDSTEKLLKTVAAFSNGEASSEAFSEEELAQAQTAAQAYIEKLSDEEKKALDVTEEDAAAAFADYRRAMVQYENIQGVELTDIDEEEERVVEGKQLYVSFSSDEEKSEKKSLMNKILEKLKNGEQINAYAAHYNEADAIDVLVARGEREQDFEDAVFALGDGEISDVIEVDGGYYLFVCEKAKNEEATAERIEAKKSERIETLFEEAVENDWNAADGEWNTSVWKEMDLSGEEFAVSVDFYEIYESVYNEG